MNLKYYERDAHKRDSLCSELMTLFNERTDTGPLLERIVVLLKDYLGCDAVGVRLMDERGNIPYSAHTGFSDAFIRKESPLCVRTDRCACIEIIKGEYDPEIPLYTSNGSFITDGLQSHELIKEGMSAGRFRGECFRSGWDTLALVPVRFAHAYYGLIHVVDGSAGRVTANDVRFLEYIAGQLGLYLHSSTALANKEKEFSYFISRMMHDLRSPLTNSMLFTELLQEEHAGRLAPEIKEYTDRIYSNSDYLMKLISSLDGYARTGDEYANREVLDLGSFIAEVVADLGLKEDSPVKVEVPEGLPAVNYPWLDLRRVLNNLISNAVKFSSTADRPAISIGCEQKDTFYVISVSDNGMGMDDADVDKVFLPFYRTADARDIPGSGLGLSICRRIVESHYGRLWVYSKKGEGSTFYFTIPR